MYPDYLVQAYLCAFRVAGLHIQLISDGKLVEVIDILAFYVLGVCQRIVLVVYHRSEVAPTERRLGLCVPRKGNVVIERQDRIGLLVHLLGGLGLCKQLHAGLRIPRIDLDRCLDLARVIQRAADTDIQRTENEHGGDRLNGHCELHGFRLAGVPVKAYKQDKIHCDILKVKVHHTMGKQREQHDLAHRRLLCNDRLHDGNDGDNGGYPADIQQHLQQLVMHPSYRVQTCLEAAVRHVIAEVAQAEGVIADDRQGVLPIQQSAEQRRLAR